jgi:hypothetical protein
LIIARSPVIAADGTMIAQRDKAVLSQGNQPDRLRRLQQAAQAVLWKTCARRDLAMVTGPSATASIRPFAMRQTESGFARNR